MRTISERDTADLTDLLDSISWQLRELAVHESWRSDAMRAVQDRTMALYHHGRASLARADATRCEQTSERLRQTPPRSRRHAAAQRTDDQMMPGQRTA